MANGIPYDGPAPLDPAASFRLDDLAPFYPAGVLENGWWTVALQLDAGRRIEDLMADFVEEARLPKTYDGLPEEARIARSGEEVFLVYAMRSFIERVNTGEKDLGVTSLDLGGLIRDGAQDPAPADPPEDLTPIVVHPETVVTAVLDNGIALGHELFRAGPAQSRVALAWAMDATPHASGSPVPRGRQFSRSEIDAALLANTQAGLLDEARFYAALGIVRPDERRVQPVARRLSHGTHVAGLAAGAMPAHAPAHRPILLVDLPSAQVAEPSGGHLTEDIGDALVWIAKHARRFRIGGPGGPRAPLVVNFSFGNFAGPHDGTGPAEKQIRHFLDVLAADLKVQIVLPSGNGNLSRCHARTTFAQTGDVETLDLRVQPDDRSASFVEIWAPFATGEPSPPGGDGLFEVTVTAPDGTTSGPVTTATDSAAEIVTASGRKIGELAYDYKPIRTKRGYVLVSLNPSASLEAPAKVAPSGLYRIAIRNLSLAADQPVRIWVARDETLPGYPAFGRQSYFDNACYARFDAFGGPLAHDPPGDACAVRRAGTLSGFATGDKPIVLGGYVRSTGRMAVYSATGPSSPLRDELDPVREGPDAAAPSDDSPVQRGVLSSGSRCGSYLAMNGTSVAAPQAARWVADRLGKGQKGDRQAVHDAGASGNSGFPGDPPSSPRAGGGRMIGLKRFGPTRG